MRAVAEADRCGGSGDLLHRHHVFEVAEAQAAPVLLDRDAVQPERAHLGPQLAGEVIGGVDLGCPRGDPVGGEAGGGLADGVGVFAKAEIKRGAAVGDHVPTYHDPSACGRSELGRDCIQAERALTLSAPD